MDINTIPVEQRVHNPQPPIKKRRKFARSARELSEMTQGVLSVAAVNGHRREPHCRSDAEILAFAADKTQKREAKVADAIRKTTAWRRSSGQAKGVEVWGIEYVSIAHAYEALGIDPAQLQLNTLCQRLKQGWTPEEAFTPGRRKRMRNKRKSQPFQPVEHDGILFTSKMQIARTYDLPPHQVYNGLAQGKTISQILALSGWRTLTVNGVEYRSARAAWVEVGTVSESVFRYRRQNGYPLPICLGLERLPSEAEREVLKQQIRSVAKIAGLRPSVIKNRMSRFDCTAEEAAEYFYGKGRYTERYFEKYPEQEQITGQLYFVTVTINGETYLKVGITKYSVEERMVGHLFETLKTLEGSLRSVFRMEQAILKHYQAHAREPKDGFYGKTECLAHSKTLIAEITDLFELFAQSLDKPARLVMAQAKTFAQHQALTEVHPAADQTAGVFNTYPVLN